MHIITCNFFTGMVAPMSPAISDQGREFVNRVNAVLFQLTGTEHRIIYSMPSSN